MNVLLKVKCYFYVNMNKTNIINVLFKKLLILFIISKYKTSLYMIF